MLIYCDGGVFWAPGSEPRGRGDCVIRQNARYPLNNNKNTPIHGGGGWRGCGVFEGYGRLEGLAGGVMSLKMFYLG